MLAISEIIRVCKLVHNLIFYTNDINTWQKLMGCVYEF